MVVAPLEHQEDMMPKSGIGSADTAADMDKCAVRRNPENLCSDSSNKNTCNDGQGDVLQTGKFAGSSASQSLDVVGPNAGPVPLRRDDGPVGVKRRRESSESGDSSSSDDSAAASYRKKRFISHREYKGRKGSPPGLGRRVRCRRRSSSCSSSPDRRNGMDLVFFYAMLIIYVHFLTKCCHLGLQCFQAGPVFFFGDNPEPKFERSFGSTQKKK